MDENDLWRLVRAMERSIEEGKDFDGVVSALMGESRTVYHTAMRRWHAEKETILTNQKTLANCNATLESRLSKFLDLSIKSRLKWEIGRAHV